MNKVSVIKALQNGLSEAIRMIEHLKPQAKSDPAIEEGLKQLKQLLVYSEHIYEEYPSKSHPLYRN